MKLSHYSLGQLPSSDWEVPLNLLDDIRSDLVNESANLPNTLRKAKILASEIKLPEFREWVDSELNGYSEVDMVPAYRRFRTINLGIFSGPFNSGVRNMVLPTYNLPPAVKEFAEYHVFLEGVGALGAQASQGVDLQVRWPQEMVMLAQDAVTMQDGLMLLVDAHQPIPVHVILGILDQVKTKLLDFVLGLQESNITLEGLANGSVQTDVVRNIFNVNISGDHNIVASGEQVSQNVSSVQPGDIESLLMRVQELDVEADDLHDLRIAVSEEPSAPDGRYGPKVKEWLGSMISKAASGWWRVGVEAGSKLLTDALNRFYGIGQGL